MVVFGFVLLLVIKGCLDVYLIMVSVVFRYLFV